MWMGRVAYNPEMVYATDPGAYTPEMVYATDPVAYTPEMVYAIVPVAYTPEMHWRVSKVNQNKSVRNLCSCVYPTNTDDADGRGCGWV